MPLIAVGTQVAVRDKRVPLEPGDSEGHRAPSGQGRQRPIDQGGIDRVAEGEQPYEHRRRVRVFPGDLLGGQHLFAGQGRRGDRAEESGKVLDGVFDGAQVGPECGDERGLSGQRHTA